MENQELNTRIEAENTEVDNNQYIEAINEMKRNSVDRSEYDKLRDENKKLLNSLINGNPYAEYDKPEPKRSADEIRKELFSRKNELNNLEYIKNALELREVLLETTGKDCFVADNDFITPTSADYEISNRVASALQSCIDYAEGDSTAFTNELQRITKDVKIR